MMSVQTAVQVTTMAARADVACLSASCEETHPANQRLELPPRGLRIETLVPLLGLSRQSFAS